MNTSISDRQIKELFNNKANVYSYDEIYKHRSINSLLNPYGFCIILYIWEDRPSYNGHWVYLGYNNKNDTLIFFDSLGNDDEDLLDKVDRPVSIRTHQSYPYLSNLINESKIYCEYNPKQLQQSHSAVCARYSCYIARNIHKYKNLFDFVNNNFTNDRKKNDELILHLTQNYFN